MYFFFVAWFSSWHLGQDLNLAFGMMDKKENNVQKARKTKKKTMNVALKSAFVVFVVFVWTCWY